MAASKKVKLPVVADHGPEDVDPENQSPRKGIVCQGCDLENKSRVPGAGAHGEVDVMFVSESPSSWSTNNHQVFYGRGGRIIRQAWKELTELDNRTGGSLGMRRLRKWDTYAVQCQVEEGRDQTAKINKSTLDRCSHYLRAAIAHKKPKIIVPLGATAMRALGYKTEKFGEARGRVLRHEIDGQEVLILPTFGSKQLLVKTGLYPLFYNDLIKAVKIASGVEAAAAQITLEELSRDYVMPKTVAEVKDLCDHIIEYVIPGAPSASKCALAVDTETNTLNPHRIDAKVLCVSFAWDSGRATAIPLWHPMAPWSPEELTEVVGHVQRVLECPKPKVFHNGGFDLRMLELRHGLRVANVAWDTLLGEHLLREDMSGAYSLKVLGRSYFPQFANYADKVGELAAKLTVEEEGVSKLLKDIRKRKIKSPGFDEGMSIEMSKSELEAYLYGDKKHRKKQANDNGYSRVPLDILLPYAAVDTDLTRRLLRNQTARVNEEGCRGALSLMRTHCIPGSRVLGKMEFDGFPVDRNYLDHLETQLGRIVDEKMSELQRLWTSTTRFYPDKRSEEFNPNSTQQVAWLLFTAGVMDPDNPVPDVNGAPRPATRQGPWCEINKKSQQFKVDKKTLKAIAEKTKCPFAKTLLEYRAAHKALTGFIVEIRVLSEYDGRLHTSFLQHGTSTGRLASRNLNMQNLPVKSIAGLNIKKLFIPDDPEEEVIFNVDWKGAEIRVFTAYARDEQLEKAINDGLDVHSWFTQEIFGIPYDEVERGKEDVHKEVRTTVKRVVFGILYGAMAKKIAETAGISEERAQEVIDKLFARFPSLKGYMDEVVASIHKHGFVETFFGRRRRFPLVRVNRFFAGQAERRGKNMKIQSTSSDIVIGQLIEIAEHIHELGGRLCITVHDSIVGTIKKKYLHLAEAFFQKYCVDRVSEKYPWLPVAFACDLTVGPSYGEAKSTIQEYIAKNAPTPATPEQEFFAEIDEEALIELREDEDEAREREQIEEALGAKAAS
jgi:uracil-DNA glycosylase family 4